MSIQTQRELEVTRAKLKLIQERCQAVEKQAAGDTHVRELSVRSLKSLIKQLQEEIARFKARATIKG